MQRRVQSYEVAHWRCRDKQSKVLGRYTKAWPPILWVCRGGARSLWLGQLAEAYGQAGQAEEGLNILAEAPTVIDKSGVRYPEADIHRLKGELLLQLSTDNTAEAETCFHQARDVARTQQAKSLELRAATSLARLWQSQDKRQDAYELLASVYGWFTEGFDTADLKDAKKLLEELEG